MWSFIPLVRFLAINLSSFIFICFKAIGISQKFVHEKIFDNRFNYVDLVAKNNETGEKDL